MSTRSQYRRLPARKGFLATVILTLTLLQAGYPHAQTGSVLEDFLRPFFGAAGIEQNFSLADCEAETAIDYFKMSGCPGYLTAIYNNDVAAIRKSKAQFTLYVESLVTPLYTDMGLFMFGPDAMHTMPPRLPYKVTRLRIRTPELIGLKVSDGARMLDKVLGPLQENAQSDAIKALREGMRRLGREPVPSHILPALGAHDSRLLMSWASVDLEGLADFLRSVEAVVDQL